MYFRGLLVVWFITGLSRALSGAYQLLFLCQGWFFWRFLAPGGDFVEDVAFPSTVRHDKGETDGNTDREGEAPRRWGRDKNIDREAPRRGFWAPGGVFWKMFPPGAYLAKTNQQHYLKNLRSLFSKKQTTKTFKISAKLIWRVITDKGLIGATKVW